ncbi:hypothetical protein HPB50_006763 [Hyalomma asiaticum]|uniref:Uncharacterized protein n=1 Tax=Hyalomma asiaticum TaxID=266040 RepID=A0ACB7SND7_HYAAI|nr:hypothetical protein HPB50_006763 [Hyalomma asiaticum]
MNAKKELDGLTFKEMRFKMCRFLEEQGVVNDLRARLRYKFVEALTITTQSTKRSSQTLLHQVILWLIQDYLSSQGYEYALCTLACESGVSQEPFSARDVEELLRLPHCDGQSVLQRIVKRMMSRPETASAQTSPHKVSALVDYMERNDDFARVSESSLHNIGNTTVALTNGIAIC